MSETSKRARQLYKQAKSILESRNEEDKIKADTTTKIVRLNSSIEALKEKREELINLAVCYANNDPELYKMAITQGELIDKCIKRAAQAVTSAEFASTREKIDKVTIDALNLLEKINKCPVVCKTKKELAKLDEEIKIYAIQKEIQGQTLDQQISMYLGSYTDDGAMGAFEQDVLAARRKAEIEGIDD